MKQGISRHATKYRNKEDLDKALAAHQRGYDAMLNGVRLKEKPETEPVEWVTGWEEANKIRYSRIEDIPPKVWDNMKSDIASTSVSKRKYRDKEAVVWDSWETVPNRD